MICKRKEKKLSNTNKIAEHLFMYLSICFFLYLPVPKVKFEYYFLSFLCVYGVKVSMKLYISLAIQIVFVNINITVIWNVIMLFPLSSLLLQNALVRTVFNSQGMPT